MNLNKEDISVYASKIPNKKDLGVADEKETKEIGESEEKEMLAQEFITAVDGKDAIGILNTLEALMYALKDKGGES